MANFKEHQTIGGLVGVGAALVCAQGQPPLLALAEICGGWIAGQHAGTWADAAEPATSSHHRKFCHALAPTAYATTLFFQQVDSLQTSLRSQAQACFQLAATTNDGLQQFVNVAAGLLLHAAAGAVPAVPASYISHIALDASSPRGVPLLFKGF
jgi:membrane-bound metal-dependent hydrolase YbcI (DUF457 family)